MKVLFFVVNYKSDSCLFRLLESVRLAVSEAPETEVRVVVLDNSCKPTSEVEAFQMALNGFNLPVTLVSPTVNTGYFGGISIAQGMVDAQVDVVMYGNPDIKLDVDFFCQLAVCKDEAGLLAPSILDELTGFNQNPKYRTRLSEHKLKRLRFIYGNNVVYAMFLALAAVKERLLVRRQRPQAEMPANTTIYAPHGALFVFSDVSFFKQLPSYPCFLFGEELFVAEEAAKLGVSIRFIPELNVLDTRHASISLLGLSRRRRYYLESVDYILKHYYS